MNANQMITLEGPKSLLNVFTHLSNKSGKIILWQNTQNKTKRICHSARIGQLNFDKGEITLYPASGEFVFHHHSFIYFFGLNRTTIFKASILYHSRLKIVIKLPNQVMMANARQEEREDYKESKRLIHYTYNAYNSNFGENVSSIYHHSRLLDVSVKGLAFSSSLNNTLRFKKGDILWIPSPFGKDHLIEAAVKYVNPVRLINQEGFLRVGVIFLNI